MEAARGDPTKEFFVEMITRDISLEACIFDLVDNSIDGAKKELARRGQKKPAKPYSGFRCDLTIGPETFRISDNCGGIDVMEAKEYAFRFGRDPQRPKDAEFGIGLYGIGMKRAMFKLGKVIDIESATAKGSFSVSVNVDTWLKKPTWDFDMEVNTKKGSGTTMEVKRLHEGVLAEINDSSFQNKLRRDMARDYSLFLQNGFELRVNDIQVAPFVFKLRVSDEMKPFSVSYEDEGVNVKIVAGLAGLPSEDFDNPDDMRRAPDEYWGWFVVCNERVVLAADKTTRTVWGDEVNDEFQQWHPQYNGFMGIVEFSSEDPKMLPWTTTKREIETTSPLYRRAVVRMREATADFIAYTNARKNDVEAAKKLEEKTKYVELADIKPSPRLITPAVRAKPRERWVNIIYQRPEKELLKVKESLGNRFMSNREAGVRTYKYYLENEVE